MIRRSLTFGLEAGARRALAVLLVGAGLVVADDGPARADSAAVPRFEPAPCPDLQEPVAVPELATARCGYLVVPENRARPDGRTIRLIVAILPAQSPQPGAAPVVHVTHGPGGIGLWDIPSLVAAGLNRDHDLVVMNQRGTYLTQPALTCQPVEAFSRQLIGLRYYAESTRQAHLAATRACREELLAKGADLSAYNSAESAADYVDLRRVLGYDQWNIFAVSYGTYLAQSLMRDHPDGIRSVILDSTVPVTEVTLPRFWDTTREAFDNLFAACEAEPACRARAPQLATTFTGLVRASEADPRTIVVANPQGEATTVVLDGGALVDWLRKKTYGKPDLRQVVDAIADLAAGRLESVANDRAAETVVTEPFAGFGLALGAVCREWNPFEPGEPAGKRAFPDYPASIQRQLVGGWAYAREDCDEVWRVPSGAPEIRLPPQADIPTLLISGTFDGPTSPRWAKQVARDLPDATLIEVPGVGHFTIPHSECAQAVAASFLSDPTAPDTSCVAGQTMPPFA